MTFKPPDDPMKGKPVLPWAEQATEAIRLLQTLVGSGDIGLYRTSRQINVLDQKDFDWAIIRATGTITARSGNTPGTGPAVVQKWNQSTGQVSDTNRTIPAVLNLFSAISTNDITFGVRFLGKWWNLPVSTSATSLSQSRCYCPEATYEVLVNCGDCRKMPMYWWLEFSAAVDHDPPPVETCGDFPCSTFVSERYRLRNTSVDPLNADCIWTTTANECITAELTHDDANGRWKLTLTDSTDCVVAIYTIDDADFNCCGENPSASWTADADNVCDLTFTFSPDPCTCCDADPPVCPPDGGTLCIDTTCCLGGGNCTISVAVSNLATPPPIPPDETPPAESCGGMNGTYAMEWVGDCAWRFSGVPGGGTDSVSALMTLSGTTWTLSIRGPLGQTAIFEATDCGLTVSLTFNDGASSCNATSPAPSATFTLVAPS